MSQASDIKDQIKATLEALVPATLKEVQVDDFKVSPLFDRDIAAYPCAIVTPPAIEGDYLTNRENERTHTFGVVIIEKMENIGSANYVENLIETILDAFDNVPTLNGKATAGSQPASTIPEPVMVRGNTGYIYFTVVIKAKSIKTLTF